MIDCGACKSEANVKVCRRACLPNVFSFAQASLALGARHAAMPSSKHPVGASAVIA